MRRYFLPSLKFKEEIFVLALTISGMSRGSGMRCFGCRRKKRGSSLAHPTRTNGDMVSYPQHQTETNPSRFSASDSALNVELEILYNEIPMWDVSPRHGHETVASSILCSSGTLWLQGFMKKNRIHAMNDATEAEDSVQCANHCEGLHSCHVHYAVKEAMLRNFPQLHNYMNSYRVQLRIVQDAKKFLGVEITKAQPSYYCSI